MRAALTLAAFAAGALAVPYNNNKRDIVTDVNVVYQTNVVTVTAGEEPEATPQPQQPQHYGHAHQWASTWASTWAVTTIVEGASSAAPEVPASTPVQNWAGSSSAPESTAVPSSASAAAPAASPTGYQDTCIFHHNLHRTNHSSPDIEWDDTLADSASIIAASCIYAHNTQVAGGGYGQNIAAGVQADNISAIITDLFYNAEEPYYAAASNNYQAGLANPDMTNFEKFGHMTQIVWKGSTKVGCATQHCPNGLANTGSDVSPYFTVCNYGPAGNYANEYGENIAAPKGDATANWNTS